MTKDEYVETLVSALVSILSKELMKRLVAKVSFLSWPVINPIAGWLVGMGVEFVIRGLEHLGFIAYIDIRTNIQADNFLEAAKKNLEAQLNGTPEEKAKREKKLQEAFWLFGRFVT